MKPYIYLLLCCSLFGCNQSNTESKAPQIVDAPIEDNRAKEDAEILAITDVIHQFYKWYESNMATIVNINYIKAGKSTTLDPVQLDAYYDLLKKSSFVSQSYIDSDRAYLKNLEATAWKNENVEEGPLTGLDFDRFFCAQDYDMAFWTAAPVRVEGLGTAKVMAIMAGTEGGSPREQQFEMVKENGKWLIAKIVCVQ